MQVQLRQQFPKLQGDLISSYHVIELPAVEGRAAPGYDVVLVVARRSRLKTVYEVLQEAGVGVTLMQSDCLALHNFLSYAYRMPQAVESDDAQPAETQQGLAVLDVGGDTANLIISSPPVVWLQSFGFGSDPFTRAMAQELQLSYADAEALKRTRTGPLVSCAVPGAGAALRGVRRRTPPHAGELLPHPRHPPHYAAAGPGRRHAASRPAAASPRGKISHVGQVANLPGSLFTPKAG